MEKVLARRDDNWKKLQQYVLEEEEKFDLTGPGGFPLWGMRREYTWFIRQGIFVRSPGVGRRREAVGGRSPQGRGAVAAPPAQSRGEREAPRRAPRQGEEVKDPKTSTSRSRPPGLT